MEGQIKILETSILSDEWNTLKKISYEYLQKDGNAEKQNKEVYDTGNGVAILLYNKEKQTVILTRQFRLPSYLNGNSTGMLIEACAGLVDDESPEDAARREVKEETGYQVREIKKIFDVFMSPGSVTEILYFFVAEYDETMKTGEGGGLKNEGEHIKVIEFNIARALDMISTGEIKDAKTIILLQYIKFQNLL